ncbi:MAG: exodeoxyribonuclease VII small subunit [Treponema sp.]|nr:exodeoxyribonuclease VII small subunit [Treponema sp.]
MAKTGSSSKAGSTVKNFEERLERLETLGEQIRRVDIPLDEALKAFEEGIKLARTLEKDLEKIDSRIEILMNSADADESPDGEEPSSGKSSPELELFETED